EAHFQALPFARRIQPHPSIGSSSNLELLNSDYFEKLIISKDSSQQTIASISNQSTLKNVSPQTKISMSTYLRGDHVKNMLPKDLQVKNIQVVSSHYLRIT